MSVATLGLASKLCGSVLGLLSTAVAWTYLPPIWLITLAYWFSAPTATMRPALSVVADCPGPDEQAVASMVTASAAAAAAAMACKDLAAAAVSGAASPRPRRGGMAHVPFTVVAALCLLHRAPWACTTVTNENHNHYDEGRQAEPASGQPVPAPVLSRWSPMILLAGLIRPGRRMAAGRTGDTAGL